MVTQSEIIDEIEFLAGSETRIRALNTIAAEGPMTSREFRDEIDASRTTVKRNLDKLVDRGWLENSNTEYTIRPCGELVAAEFTDLIDAIRIIRELQPFMRWVDLDDLDFGLYELVDAEVTVASDGDPYAPVNEHVDALQTANEVRALLPSVGHEAFKVILQRLNEADPAYDLVVKPACAKTLQEGRQYEALFEEAIASGAVEVSLYEGVIPYYLGVLDETVQIGVEDDDGFPRALVETESETVRA